MTIKQKQNRKKAISELLSGKIKSRAELMAVKRKLAKKYGVNILSHAEILKEYRNKLGVGTVKEQPELERVLRKRSVRTMSGIAPVAVLTKPYPCPGKCAYCPTEKDVPQSYLSNEPAVMRAIRCNYEPYKQIELRLRALEANGHEPTKIELIVIGGTWSVLPENYKYWYIAECFKAANEFEKKKKFKIKKFNLKLKIEILKKLLSVEQKKNERAKYKIIGVTLETRPDYINEKELLEMRELGATRVELGVQAIDDKILTLNKRGHGVAEIAQATERLKNFGFKVTYHIMPGLPGSTARKDLAMFKTLFSDQRFQPDQLKFYPTVVTRGSLLYRWWKAGKYKPYSDKVLQNLIVACKKVVPPYVRIIRLIRDIPGESIMAGNLITNLRQVMKDRGVACRCIRCREAKEQKLKVESIKLKVLKYKASSGLEYFLSYESKDGKVLYGFCRLRLENAETPLNPPFARGVGLIRELHVYGELVSVGGNKKVQHAGLGKLLMQEAEKIAKKQDYKKIAVIAGVGVRGYYRKLGYRLNNSYMVKD
ncbi:MAG: tRNA uridine(34) 5-carboxymethylaminomethyl modification radical SAM/GNAT enzyme Elp3 [bacterium]|nr:tRNA uridine(34) 5-carboxymethylaminomethyl modification radical SAM/GNAT enzyme Elp3 [bacterium]